MPNRTSFRTRLRVHERVDRRDRRAISMQQQPSDFVADQITLRLAECRTTTNAVWLVEKVFAVAQRLLGILVDCDRDGLDSILPAYRELPDFRRRLMDDAGPGRPENTSPFSPFRCKHSLERLVGISAGCRSRAQAAPCSDHVMLVPSAKRFRQMPIRSQ